MRVTRAVPLALLVLLLVDCGSGRTPTAAPSSSVPTATAVVTTLPSQQPSPLPSHTPGAPSPASSPAQTPATPPVPSPIRTASPTPPTLEPTAQPSPPPPASTQVATSQPEQPTPAVAYLTLPTYAPLMPPPPGKPDSPLLGVTALGVSPRYPVVPLMAAGTDGNGVLVSWTGGETWFWSTVGLPPDATITDLTVGPDEIAVLVMPGSAFRSVDAGRIWEPIPGLGDGVEQIAYSPGYPDDGILFAVADGALLRSADGGASWTTVLPPSGCPLNVTLSPAFATDGTVYAPQCDHVVRSSDGGLSWTEVPVESSDLETGHLKNLQVAPDYPASSRLLAQGGTQMLPLLSADGGRHWSWAYDAEQLLFAFGTLRTVQIAPDGRLFAAGRAHAWDSGTSVWRSEDGGQQWHAVARAAGFGGLALAPDMAWLGTPDGVFFDGGAGWQFLHPGGSQPLLVEPPSYPDDQVAVALMRRAVNKYTARLRLFERSNDHWQLVFEERTDRGPRRAFPSPTYSDQPLILLLGQDYGGWIWVMALRPGAIEPLEVTEDIPAGPGGSLDRYTVRYAEDFAASGRIELRHGYSGALYISLDHGASWSRPDPAEPGACERNPVSGFGALWFGNDAVRGRLQCPLEDEQPYSGTAQSFEHGELLRLDPITTSPSDRQTYALVPEWEAWGTLPVYEADVTLPQTPAGFFPPASVFRVAWAKGYWYRPNPQPAMEVLGWATSEAHSTEIAKQRFEGGTMIWRGDRDEILVLERTSAGDLFTVFPD